MVYATAFGMAKTAIEQMKARYPEVFIQEKWDDEIMAKKYPIIYFSANPIYYDQDGLINPISDISNNVGDAYNISITEMADHITSSGGSSSGRRPADSLAEAEAGGGRWTEWAEDRRKLYENSKENRNYITYDSNFTCFINNTNLCC